MCGIVAVTGPEAGPVASRLLDLVGHRGPDDSGSADFGHVVLAMARLAILDTNPRATQPMSFAGRHLVYNGEIYNFAELRAELEGSGLSFSTSGDTEVVLKGVAHWGKAACARFRGMFALVVLDETTGELWATRDRFGIKPLYWRRRESGGVALASEASPLAALGRSPVSLGAVAELLRFGSPITAGIFEGVSELEPGKVTVWAGDGSVRTHAWAAACPPAAERRGPGALLRESVAEHLVSDRPLAIFLSGGFDSAALAALAKGAGQSPVALTLCYPGNDADLARARATAAHYDLDHRVAHLGAGDLVEHVGAFLGSMDQPTVDGFNTFLVSSLAAANGIPVALSGLGGDEILGGYGYYRRLRQFQAAGRLWHHLPDPLRRMAAGAGSRLYHRPCEQLVAMLEAGTLPDLHRAWRSLFSAREVARLTGVTAPMSERWRVDTDAPARAQLHQLDLAAYLGPVLLRDSDVYAMAHGVELRVPFLDHRLVTTAAARQCPTTKLELARQLGDPYLVDLAQHPKLSFSLPWGAWLQAAKEAAAGPLAEVDPWRGLVDPEVARPILERAGAERRHTPLRAWALAALAAWLARGPDGRRLPAAGLSAAFDYYPRPSDDGSRRTGRPLQERRAPQAAVTPSSAGSVAPEPSPLRPTALRVALLGMEWVTNCPGGLNRRLASLQAALGDKGIDAVAVVAGPVPGGVPAPTSSERIDRPFTLRALGYWRRSRSLSVDVVDAHFAPYAALPTMLGPLRSVPLVVHFQGPWADESQIESTSPGLSLALKRVVERAAYRRAAQVVVLSRAFRHLLVELYGLAPWNIHVVPPGVDLAHFSPGSMEEARAALGIPAEAPVAVAVRQLVSRTGVDVLLEAWALVAQQRPDARLLLAGDGPHRRLLEARSTALGLSSPVRFLGLASEPDLVTVYRAADVSVVPSLALEGLGSSVLESLACGAPVIATDVGGLPEALADLDPSLVVPPADPGALGRRILGAFAGSVPLPPAEACRAHAERYSWGSAADQTLAVYRRALDPMAARGTRVVYIDHCALLSGGELALLRLLPALQGVEAHVILAEDGPLADRLMALDVSVEVMPMAERARGLHRQEVRAGRASGVGVGLTLPYTAKLARRLHRLQPDLVHTNSLKSALYGGAAARLAGIPVVWHLRDRVAADYLPAGAVAMVRAAALVLPSAVLANSQATLDALGRHRGPGAVAPSPVVAIGSPAPRRLDRPLAFGMVGRLAPWKGQDVFLRAFAAAFPDGAERAVVVGGALFGETDYEEGLSRLVADLGLEGRVRLAGFREDVSAEMAGMDVLVHASVVPEPLGQVVLEGMAAGLPVVATAAGGPAEMVTDGVDGLLYPPGDAAALATLLRRLAGDPRLRESLGKAAKLRSAAWAPAQVAGQVCELYGQVLGRRQGFPLHLGPG